MNDIKNESEKYFQACLQLIKNEGWSQFSFFKAAETANLPLVGFYEYFKTPIDIFVEILKQIDHSVIHKCSSIDKNLTWREKLFEIVMCRLDANEDYKTILHSFWVEWVYDPLDGLNLLQQGKNSMVWMLELAGLEVRGIKGALRIKGLSILYVLTLREWLKDDSPDLAKTMAFLDQGLGHLEYYSDRFQL